MKTISTEFQHELLDFLSNHPDPKKAYFLEELRPKRVRKRVSLEDSEASLVEAALSAVG